MAFPQSILSNYSTAQEKASEDMTYKVIAQLMSCWYNIHSACYQSIRDTDLNKRNLKGELLANGALLSFL